MLTEKSSREGQSSSNQKEVEEERIILRISRKSNKLSVVIITYIYSFNLKFFKIEVCTSIVNSLTILIYNSVVMMS